MREPAGTARLPSIAAVAASQRISPGARRFGEARREVGRRPEVVAVARDDEPGRDAAVGAAEAVVVRDRRDEIDRGVGDARRRRARRSSRCRRSASRDARRAAPRLRRPTLRSRAPRPRTSVGSAEIVKRVESARSTNAIVNCDLVARQFGRVAPLAGQPVDRFVELEPHHDVERRSSRREDERRLAHAFGVLDRRRTGRRASAPRPRPRTARSPLRRSRRSRYRARA